MSEQKQEKYKKIAKNFHFYGLKYLCFSHGHVFVMHPPPTHTHVIRDFNIFVKQRVSRKFDTKYAIELSNKRDIQSAITIQILKDMYGDILIAAGETAMAIAY